ncbi:MAG: glycoside hydrolase family 38 C-terminal domain-containing protein, partial [bacterium]
MKKRAVKIIPIMLASVFIIGVCARSEQSLPVWLGDITALTEFTGSESEPFQVLQLKITNRSDKQITGLHLTVSSDSIVASRDAFVDLTADETRQVNLGFRAKPGLAEGALVKINVAAESDGQRIFREETVAVSRSDWKLFFVPGFHYDPEWWNTQYNYLENYNEDKKRGVFELIKAYLEMARVDPDYKFVLEAIPYMKPYWDMYPEDRSFIRQLMKEGRLELMGGSYNEPQSTLVSGEANIRNIIYGMLYMRGVWGGNPETSWQCDVFGHTPNWPQFNVKAGVTGSSWARGPFHRWAIDRDAINFPQDFFWVSPDGSKLLTSFMSCFYGCGRKVGDNPAGAENDIKSLFADQKKNAATPNILLPMVDDFILPGKDIGEIARAWNSTHISPKARVGTVKDFFNSVRSDAQKDNVRFAEVSRDMNPVFKGCAISFIDQKQANREIENRLTAAEAFASVATMFGAKYPSRALDKSWRELLFFSHHDGITGSESDQVYLDLSNSLREAYELSGDVLNRSTDFIGSRVKTESFRNPVAVFNPLAWARKDIAIFPAPAGKMLVIRDSAGKPVLAQKISPDSVAALVSVPAMGYAVFDVGFISEKAQPKASAKKTEAAAASKALVTIENEFYKLTVDPSKGGAMTSLKDVRSGREYLKSDMKSLGNDLVAYKEYPVLPDMGEGPWSIYPTGERYYSHDYPATVKVVKGSLFSRVIVTGPFKNSSREQRITLYKGVDRVDFETRVTGYNDSDWLFRVQFPASISGGRPVYEVANAAVARSYTFDVDTKQQKWLIENAAYNWLDFTAPLRLEVKSNDGPQATRSLGVGEIVLPDSAGDLLDESAYKLVATLVNKTVTTTPTRASKRRYGDIKFDSNLPDFRISIGPMSDNAYTARVVSELPADAAEKFSADASAGPAVLWIDNRADGIPVLIVTGPDSAAASLAVDNINDGIASSGVLSLESEEFIGDSGENVDAGGFMLINNGTPSAGALEDGQIMLDLFRSSSAWPSGLWLDPPQKKVPDGSNFEVGHWPHVFKYSIRLHGDDWRKAGAPRVGYEANFPFVVRPLNRHAGELPAQMSFMSVSPQNFVITA